MLGSSRVGPSTHLRPGDNVVGFVEGSLAEARSKSSSICTMPENLSFAAAAALPTIYCTAHYGLGKDEAWRDNAHSFRCQRLWSSCSNIQLGQSCTGRKWGEAEALTLDGFDRQSVQIAGRAQGAY